MTQPDLRSIAREAEIFDGAPPISDQALLAAEQGRRRVFGAGSDAVGILGEGELDLVVRPGARGNGLGTRLLAQLLDAAGTDELRAWSHGENPAATALLTRAGFAPIRVLFRLALDIAQLDAAVADARPLPEGFSIEVFDGAADTGGPDSPRESEWVRVNAAAFADHPEQGAITLDDFRSTMAQPWFDPNDLLLAIDETNGAIAGYGWIKTIAGGTPDAAPETELYVLGVSPEYAGRGLGAALFGASLARMRDLGTSRITLYVDESNTNAVQLYMRGGFTIDQRSTQWLRSTPPI